MFKFSDILIVGDSFAGMRELETDWPVALTKLLVSDYSVPNRSRDNLLTYHSVKHRNPRGEGFPGASWWSTRRCLLAELDQELPKVVVICHTEANRIPNDYDFGITAPSADANMIVVPNTIAAQQNFSPNIAKSAAAYYKYLSSEEYANWAMTAWFKELDEILAMIPHVVHLHCFEPHFDGNKQLYQFKTGITSTEILFNIAPDKTGCDPNNVFRNHFTVEQNVKIANAINMAVRKNVVGFADLNLLGTHK